MLEEFIRHDAKTCGVPPKQIVAIVADFRQKFAGHFDHAPRPELIAMVEAEKQETTDFVKHLEQLTKYP